MADEQAVGMTESAAGGAAAGGAAAGGTGTNAAPEVAGGAVLYRRKGSYIPRVAAVHDMCGYGKCSLTVAIPVLSAGGCDVCPVPTALFSAHTRYPVFTMHDTTEILAAYLDAWREEGVDLDGVYSGFLGAPEQVDIIMRLYDEYPRALRVVDPVMGDGGQIYTTYTPELCDAMKGLAGRADLLTPNLTEASILTGIAYRGQDVDDAYVSEMLDALLATGAKHVVLKGIDRGDGMLRNYVATLSGEDKGRGDAESGAEGRAAKEVVELAHGKLPYMLHGTGDLYCSALVAAVFCGKGVVEAARFAGEFVREAMVVTRDQPEYEMRGVSFEPCLSKVAALLR